MRREQGAESKQLCRKVSSQAASDLGPQRPRPPATCLGCGEDGDDGRSALGLRLSFLSSCLAVVATESSTWQCGGLLSINGNIGLAPSITQDRPLHPLCNLCCDDFIRGGGEAIKEKGTIWGNSSLGETLPSSWAEDS